MKATKGVAVALMVLGAVACNNNRRDNAGQTNTTSGDYDRQRDTSGAAPAAPVTTPQDLPPSGDQTSAGSNIDQDMSGVQGGNADYARRDGGSRMSGTGSDLTDHPSDQAGSTSVTSGDVNQNQNNATDKSQNADKGTSKGKNDSTTLGTGKSGEYTGGKGTYGGKATWGTGHPKK